MYLDKVTVILRGYTYEQIRVVAKTLINSSIRSIEISLNTIDAFNIIEKLSYEFSSELFIGAGTILNLDNLKKAEKAGAKFVLSPCMMSREVIKYCNDKGIIAIPGAFTPTEIKECFHRGADIVKVFPANEFNIGYGAKVKEPLGKYKLMAVGGINASNYKLYLQSGYDFVASAGGIFRSEDIVNCNEDQLLLSIKNFE
ncbi:MAG: bifunctional 4-hydroxy-2-oxoglutarate aldolase/2-dehydro-3-deoxy-phosphogluconate aldolase [Tissierellia bacterium]|nr:bifunctional 4-hydroxy-2-oxoglutarate aldolase/2-dehydro-3-deoxy-phosphogluconate aldolase [Tissierellia bacterium]